MKGCTSPLLLFASALLASAADSASPAPSSAPSPGISPQTAARVTAELPGFTPSATPEPTVPAPLASPSSTAPRNFGDNDLPGDDVVRLPRYEVRERPLPLLRERDLLTREGRVALVQKRHPGLKFGPLSRLNLRRGLEMLAEEQQIERNREMSELIGFQRFVAATRRPSATPTRVAAE